MTTLRVPEDVPNTVLCANCGHKRWTFFTGTIMVERCPDCADSEYRYKNHEREVKKYVEDP